MCTESGEFVLQAPEPGDYYLLVEAMGYHPYIDGILEFEEGGFVPVDFYVRPKPIEMDSLVVAMTRLRAYKHLESFGFYDRRDQGFGQFIDWEEIEDSHARDLTTLLRHRVSGIRIDNRDGFGERILFVSSHPGGGGTARQAGGLCEPQLYVDGMPIAQIRPMNDSTDIGVRPNEIVSFEDIAGIEIHTRATSVPLQYGGTQVGCGVLLIWTKSGGGR